MVKRYEPTGFDSEPMMREESWGEWVRFSDYAALKGYANHKSTCRLMTALRHLPNLNSCTCGWESVRATDSADDDPYRRAAQQSLDAEREGLARARADGTAERAVDDLLKILGK
jgi:hypothetical protein